jgi:murein DD-endopeptidase MepM/ murein hydrolase activator NlpD
VDKNEGSEEMFSIFNRDKKNLPQIKKAGDFINQKSHKQKKYISLMVVPSYSGSRTRSLHIPHAVFYGIIFVFFFSFSLIGGCYLRNIYFEQMTRNLSYTLEETIETFGEFRQTAEDTHTYLIDNSIQVYNRLNNEQTRAQAELYRLERRHQYNFDGVQSHVENLERQIQEFEEERLEILEFLSERGQKIPPIADTLRRLEISQENLFYELHENRQATAAAPSRIGLMGVGLYAPVTEAELLARLEILAEELEIQRKLFENLESYRSRIDTYLRNFPTLMPIVGGRITSGFGFRRDPIHGGSAFHEGVDIPAPTGTAIHAAGGGTVTYSGWRGGYGNVVFIDHGGGLSTRYAHNTRNLVSVGDIVERGQVIAYVGSTGRSISPHLHYEVLRNGRHINPVPFITEEWE